LALADPQTVTVNSVAKTLALIVKEGRKSTYLTSDGLFELTVSHQPSKDRVRSQMQIVQKAIVADPLTAVNDYDFLKFYCVFDHPNAGFTLAQSQQLIAAFQVWLDSTMVGKIVGQES